MLILLACTFGPFVFAFGVLLIAIFIRSFPIRAALYLWAFAALTWSYYYLSKNGLFSEGLDSIHEPGFTAGAIIAYYLAVFWVLILEGSKWLRIDQSKPAESA